MRRSPRGHEAVRAELAGLWSRVLGAEPGPQDTFTGLGGSSLAVEETIVASRTALVRPLTVADFADDPTLDEQADRVLRRHRRGFASADTSCQQLRPGAPAVYCFAGAGASAAWYLPLVAALTGPDTADLGVYGIQAHGLHSRARASWTVRGAARRYRRQLTAGGGAGPYLLVGHSFGGVVALETARLLHADGYRVERIVLLDTVVDADAALHRWTAGQEGFAETTPDRLPRPLRLAADLASALGAGLVRYDPARQKEVFWALGMRAQRGHRIRIPAGVPVTVLLTADAPGQAPRWQELGVAPEHIHDVPGGHLSMITEPAVLAAIETALVAAPTQ